MIIYLANICDYFKQDRHVFYIAIDLMDRYFTNTYNLEIQQCDPRNDVDDQQSYHLILSACLFISSKYFMVQPIKLKDLIRTCFSENDSMTPDMFKDVEIHVFRYVAYTCNPRNLMEYTEQLIEYFLNPEEKRPTTTAYMNLYTRASRLSDLIVIHPTSMEYNDKTIAAICLSQFGILRVEKQQFKEKNNIDIDEIKTTDLYTLASHLKFKTNPKMPSIQTFLNQEKIVATYQTIVNTYP